MPTETPTSQQSGVGPTPSPVIQNDRPERRSHTETLRRLGWFALLLALATVIWLPLVHLLFKPGRDEFRAVAGLAPRAAQMAQFQRGVWRDRVARSRELGQMRISNPEWDYMARTFFVMSLAEMCYRDPMRRGDYLKEMDDLIDETRSELAKLKMYYFLMDYARGGIFIQKPARSLFIDGELALMMGARRIVEEKSDYRQPMRELVDTMATRMQAAPALSSESYPNECWLFCNTVALAAIKMSDLLDGQDHSEFFERWLTHAKSKLLHRETGLLYSLYDFEGERLDGPEGSSIWMAAHCLRIIDPAFAADQYARARRELGRELLGFAWAREWPVSWTGGHDVDSGPIIPLVEASAGSSGLALLGAASFDDGPFYDRLVTSLMFAGFPQDDGPEGLRFCAGNQVGDAVVLYSAVVGPLWDDILKREKANKN